jgi:type I restriction enzyme S subunit
LSYLPNLRITDIRDDGTIDFDGLKSVDDPNASKYFLSPNDIVFARTGASTGRNYFYDGTDGYFVYAGFLIKFSIDPEKVNPLYIKYYCQSEEYFNWVQSFNTGSTRGNINAQTFGDMPIELPPREQQNLLAATLSTLDDKIAVNTKLNHRLEQMAQAIFKSWFVDFEPWSGVMPNDWREGVLADVVSQIYSGGTPNTKTDSYWNGDIPWLSSGETGNAFITTTTKSITPDGVKSSSTRLAHRHDVVMASAGQGFTRGQTSLLLLDTYVNQSVIVMSGENTLYVFLNLSDRYEELRAISDSHSIRGSITTKMLADFPMCIPSPQVLKDFSSEVLPLINSIENNLLDSERLAVLRDSLLPKLMSGEISVDG